MQLKTLIAKVTILGVCATAGVTAIDIGQASSASTVSAATAYETKVIYGVNFRSQPSTSGSKIGFLSKGEAIHVVSKVNSYWLKIQRKNGQTGYISANSKYTNYGGSSSGGAKPGSGSSVSSKADQVISLAKSYSGRVSYDYGTRNTSKLIFDCSSFTEFIFAKVGVDLKWGTKYQKSQGKAVSKSNLSKGDLVFFDTVGSNNKAINHVGIYMGGGQFIHNTPSKDGLAINSLNSGWWSDHYVSARRVL